MKSNNRFLQLHKGWQSVILIVWILALIASLEGIGYLYFKIRPTPTEVKQGYADKSTYAYYPYISYRYPPNTKDVRSNLDTDKMGFIHNGDANRDLTIKNEGTYRIFLLGGSSVAGTYSTPETTLSGYLEKN